MTISEYLKKNGPSLSSVLIKEFSTDSISQNAIRQRLSRLKSPIKKLKGFFKDNQSFFYLEEQFLSEQYKVNLWRSQNTHINYWLFHIYLLFFLLLHVVHQQIDILPEEYSLYRMLVFYQSLSPTE